MMNGSNHVEERGVGGDTSSSDGLSSLLHWNQHEHQPQPHPQHLQHSRYHRIAHPNSINLRAGALMNYVRSLATTVTDAVTSLATTARTSRRSFESVDREDPLLLHDDNHDDDGLRGGGSSPLLTHPSDPLTLCQQQQQQQQQQTFRFQRPLLHPDNRRAAFQILRRLGDYLAYLTLLTMLVVIPVVLYRALSLAKVDLAAWNSAGVMACGTVILSSRQVYLHLTHWYMPEVQKYVVRILWMVPIYSIQSWLSLRFHNSRIYIDTVRDLYEAYVIASFVYYLIELLGGQDALVHILLQKRDTELGQHPFPLRLILQRWELGAEFMLQCKHGVLQYVVFKSIASFLTYFCEMAGLYGEGTFSWKVAYPYMCFFQNMSVMYALYSLVMLYSAVKEELEYPVNWKPLGKFLCIKGVVFFTWWQGVIIFYLQEHGIIGEVGGWSSRDVAYGLIDYCIVIEMVGFAIAHSYTFTYKEYLPGSVPSRAEMLCQQQEQQQQHQQREASLYGGNADEEDLVTGTMSNIGSEHGSSSNLHQYHQRNSSYRPPATLEQPMNFREALWSSTVPRETIQDIQRLRTGFENALQEQKVQLLSQQREQEMTVGDPRTTSSSNINNNDNNNNSDFHLGEEVVDNNDDDDDDDNGDRIDNAVDDDEKKHLNQDEEAP